MDDVNFEMVKSWIDKLNPNDLSVKNIDLLLKIQIKLQQRKKKLERDMMKLTYDLNEVNYYLAELEKVKDINKLS